VLSARRARILEGPGAGQAEGVVAGAGSGAPGSEGDRGPAKVVGVPRFSKNCAIVHRVSISVQRQHHLESEGAIDSNPRREIAPAGRRAARARGRPARVKNALPLRCRGSERVRTAQQQSHRSPFRDPARALVVKLGAPWRWRWMHAIPSRPPSGLQAGSTRPPWRPWSRSSRPAATCCCMMHLARHT
jgi:hypothetical protein